MNLVIRTLFERKSVRVFEEKPILKKEKELILEAAFQAPTAGNQMLYTILDIQDQSIKEALAESCDHQPFIAKAPLVLVFLADCRRWLDTYVYAGASPRKPRAGDLFLACADALIAAQNSVIAAQSMGIGSCYIGDILENKEEIVSLLKLDKYVLPIAMVVYGYPTKQQQTRPKPLRFKKPYLVMKDYYRPLTEEEIRRMFYERDGRKDFNFEDYIITFCNRKYMSEFSIEMSCSAEEYLKEYE